MVAGRLPAEVAAIWNRQELRPVGYSRDIYAKLRTCLPMRRTPLDRDLYGPGSKR